MNDLPQPMRTVWHSLLWKEWHEHKWKLAALTAICVGPLCLFGMDEHSNLLVGMFVIPMCYCLLAGTFLGMSTAGRESGRETLSFLQSLPVPMWQAGAAKLFVALLTAILPLLALVGAFCVGWSLLWFDGAELSRTSTQGMGFADQSWGISNWLVSTTVCSVLGVSSLLLWMAALGMNRADEIRAGAIGFLIICFVWFAWAFGYDLAEKHELPTLTGSLEVLLAAAPGGVAVVGVDKAFPVEEDWWAHALPFLVSAIIGHGCLLAWYLRRYGKVVPGTSRTDGKTLSLAAKGYQHLTPPRRSQLTAVAWKQVRETGPLALLAIGGVLLLTAIFYLSNKRRGGMRDLGETMAGITMMVGFFVTLVTGIGVFLEDMKPRVDDFWRSRPVNYQLWFGVKFVVGAAVLAVSFGTLLLLANLLTVGRLVRDEFRNEEQAQIIGAFILVFFLIYTLSMATYCVLRQPLYAAVLTIGLLVGGMLAFGWAADYFFDNSVSWQAALALLLLCQVAATVLAWQAVKRNWNWGNQ